MRPYRRYPGLMRSVIRHQPEDMTSEDSQLADEAEAQVSRLRDLGYEEEADELRGGLETFRKSFSEFRYAEDSMHPDATRAALLRSSEDAAVRLGSSEE